MPYRILISILLALRCADLKADQPAHALTVGISEGWSMPFEQIQRQGSQVSLAGGIIYDWHQALGTRLGRPVEFKVLPRVRIDVITLEPLPDLRCFSSTEWHDDTLNRAYHWAKPPILVIEDRLVSLPGTPLVEHLEQLQSRSVGAVLGYRYPLLDAMFQGGQIQRDNALTEMNMLEKQLVGRTDYSVIHLLSLEYLQTIDEKWRALRVSPLVVASTPLYCAVWRGSSLKLAELEAALTALAKAGTMQDILRKYRSSDPARPPKLAD